MPTRSFADEQRASSPLQYEKSRLVIDATTDLKLALEDHGLTISALARRMGRGRAILARQLSGQENLTLGKLAELAFHLGKRFELSLADIAAPESFAPDPRYPVLTWSRRERPQKLRLVVSEPDGPTNPSAPDVFTPAA